MLTNDVQNAVISTAIFTVYGFGPHAEPTLSFTGERRDAISQGFLLGNGQRLYRPGLMRFCSADSLSPFGKGGLNAYAYCQGDPVNYFDRSGHDHVRTVQQAVGGATGVINLGMSGLKVATPIIKRSIQAAHQNMSAEQYLRSPDRLPEYPLMARAGNSIATVANAVGLVLATPPGILAAWQAQSSASSILSSATRLGTGGAGAAGRGMQAWSSIKPTLEDIKQYNISYLELGREVAMEMFGVNLMLGRESGIVSIQLPEEMRNVIRMPATKELLEGRVTTV